MWLQEEGGIVQYYVNKVETPLGRKGILSFYWGVPNTLSRENFILQMHLQADGCGWARRELGAQWEIRTHSPVEPLANPSLELVRKSLYTDGIEKYDINTNEASGTDFLFQQVDMN